MFTSAVGLSSLPGFPYIDRQCFGAAIGIFISVLVLNLRHFRGVFRIARHRTGEDANEPVSYRFALWGIIVGLALLFIFSKRIGMSFWLIPIFFGIYFIIVLVLTRMRAEQGFPVHAMENMPNHHILVDGFGTRCIRHEQPRRLDPLPLVQSELYEQPDATPIRGVSNSQNVLESQQDVCSSHY